jgi:hypothetical protein
MNAKEIGWEDANWIHQTQDRLQWQTLLNIVMNLWIPQQERNILSS